MISSVIDKLGADKFCDTADSRRLHGGDIGFDGFPGERRHVRELPVSAGRKRRDSNCPRFPPVMTWRKERFEL